ncbi:MAG: hypothetical protein QM597_06760 [Aeromicrobium sp.]|uniref:hypothetical protein n=1 Tax=Aeromicrobium sp. TaxID=1871063 RepID=UPI0039E575CF
MNRARVTITGLDTGWVATVTQGIPTDPAARLVVTDNFTYKWGFTDERVPNPLDPATLQFGLAARTAADLPDLQPGDLYRVILDLVDVTGEIVTVLKAGVVDFVGRLAEPEVELIPSHKWPVRARLTLTDLLSDLRARMPAAGPWPLSATGIVPEYQSPARWLSAWAEQRAGINLWVTAGIAAILTDDSVALTLDGTEVPDENAHAQVSRILAGAPDSDGHLTALRWRYTTSAPDSGEYVPCGWLADGTGNLPDMTEPVGFLAQRIDRTTPAASLMPFTLAYRTTDGVVTLALDAPDIPAGIAVINARHVTIPATARKARDEQVNTVVIAGRYVTYPADPPVLRGDTTLEITAPGASTAPRSRSVDTRIVLAFDYADAYGGPAGAAEDNAEVRARLTAAYQPDEAATSAEWVYDALTVRSESMTAAEYTAIGAMLAPAHPESDDAVLLRQVVIHGVALDVDLTGRGVIAGLLVAATITLEAGQLRADLQLAPGTLPPAADSGAVTYTSLAARPAPVGTVTHTGIDPTLTYLDLRLTA